MDKHLIYYINNLMRASPLIIIIIAVILLIIALKIKNNGFKKPKLKRKIWVNIKNLYKRTINFILSKESFEYLSADLKKLNKNFTVYKFYALKIGLCMIASILSIGVFVTNFNYKSNAYIQQELEENDIELYKNLKELYNSKDLKSSAVEIRDELMSKGLGMTAANVKAIKLLSVMQAVNDIKFNFIRDIWFVIIPFAFLFVPNLAVKAIKKYKESMYQRDLPILKISTYLLADMGLKVKDILYFLEPLTPTYKEVFKKGLKNFNAIPVGQTKAIMMMTEEVNFLHFRRLCNSFRDMLTSNKEQTVKNLEIDIELEEKENQMRIEAKIGKNGLIAIFLISILLFLMLLLILCPMLKYLQDFNLTI